MLARMFNGSLQPSATDAQGNYVIDRDGELFRYILAFLRSSKLVLPKKFPELDMLKGEAEFYQIPELIEAVKDYHKLNLKPTAEPSNDVYMLNVGGTIFPILGKYLIPSRNTHRFSEADRCKTQTLTLYSALRTSESTDGLLVLGNLWKMLPNTQQDPDGNYIVDCDHALFRHILNFVWTCRFHMAQDFCAFKQLQFEMDKLEMNISLLAVLKFQGEHSVYKNEPFFNDYSFEESQERDDIHSHT